MTVLGSFSHGSNSVPPFFFEASAVGCPEDWPLGWADGWADGVLLGWPIRCSNDFLLLQKMHCTNLFNTGLYRSNGKIILSLAKISVVPMAVQLVVPMRY